MPRDALDRVVEHALGHQERGGVAMLFVLDHARHALHALHHFRIGPLHQLGDEAGQLVEERIFHADHAHVAQRAPHDLAQHVAAAFVGGHHAVVDQERGGARVVGGDAQHGIDARIVARRHAEHLRRVLDDRADQVGIVVRDLALQDRGDALQAHAGIDGGPRQRRQLARKIAVVLHEDQVPDLDEAAAARRSGNCSCSRPGSAASTPRS